MKQKQNHGHRQETGDCLWEGVRGGVEREAGVSKCTLLCIECITTRSYCIAQRTIFNDL